VPALRIDTRRFDFRCRSVAMPSRFSLGACAVLCLAEVAFAAPGYYRDPSLRGDTIVFTAEGDLWSVPLAGGLARRLTSHPAEESQAAISPDGRHVAFVASYDGAPDVYAMALAGGEPRRLSFDGGRVWVQGFTPRGEVVYATENVIGPTLRRVLRAVDLQGDGVREFPLADAREASFDAQGERLWFTRFGLQVSGDNAQDYRGGAMAQVWRWSGDASQEAIRIAADLEANLSMPMWTGERLIAVSDAGGRANLWSMDGDGGDRRALTSHRDFDVRGAELDAGRVVYQLGADLRVFDLRDGSDRRVPIELGSDYGQRRSRFVKQPLAHLGAARIAPDGRRAVLTARGNVAIAGTGPLRRIDLPAPPDSRLREAVLSHDGKLVHAIVDGNGRSEIWSFPADGTPGGKALTRDGERHRWRLYPSPDGRWLAHDNKDGELWLLDLRSGDNRRIDVDEYARDDAYGSVVWSHDSRYLALARSDSARLLSQIVVLDPASGRRETVTSDRYESFSPEFSRDGKWLYFLSNRSFQSSVGSPWGDRNTGAFFDQRTKLYALALQPGLRFPFLVPDEISRTSQPDDAEEKQEKKEASERGAVAKTLPGIAFDGLRERLFELPVEPGNYNGIAAIEDRLYFLQRDASPDAKGQLMTLEISDQSPKPELFMADVAQFSLSDDGKRLLLIKSAADPGAAPGELLLLDAGAKAPGDLANARLRVADWSLRVDPSAEWRQMFDDAWRMHREFSFDPAMRGQDWAAVRARYAPLLERVNDRSELDDLLGQMSSELGILHSQVRGGQLRADPDAPQAAALGAQLSADRDGVRIATIYRTDPELPSERGPLQQPGVDARDGDRLLAINGQPVRSLAEVADRLRQQAGQQVLLTLKRGGAAEHRTVVVPVRLERDAALRYGDWVERSRARVQDAGAGRLGYLHLRAMTVADMASFVREFYANVEREGLIIDVRRNRGGNIDSWILEKLLRRAWAFWQPPRGVPYPNMQQTFRGHLAVLADAFTYSDGETFAAGVKALQLGPVIGTRTSGAGIWLSDRNRLADNGVARVAEFGQFDVEGRWLIEGRGVAPDVVVDNLPVATARGGDAQLDAAIANLLERLRTAPIQPLRAQPIPARGTPGHDGSR
jgi:tricorn protease